MNKVMQTSYRRKKKTAGGPLKTYFFPELEHTTSKWLCDVTRTDRTSKMQNFNAARVVSAQDTVDLCLVRTDQILQLLERAKSTEITDKRYDVSADTSELKTTLERVKKVLGFGAIKLIDGSLDVFCIVAIQASLDQLKKILMQQEACVTFSSWCDTKIKLYNLDLLLFFQLDQVVALFSDNDAFDAAQIFTDIKNVKVWQELFGRQVKANIRKIQILIVDRW